MESYIDTIKEYAQKLVASGIPLEDDDLICLSYFLWFVKGFIGFKTAIRSRGDTTFDELVKMLNVEDIQMIKDDESETTETTSVLVATHMNQSSQGSIPIGNVSQNMSQNLPQNYSNTTSQNIGSVLPSQFGS